MIAGVLFYLYRRRKCIRQKQQKESTEVEASKTYNEETLVEEEADGLQKVELFGDQHQRQELGRDEKRVMSVYEMYHPAVELEAADSVPAGRGRSQPDTKREWM